MNLPDDQDRMLTYYTPLQDIFMRPALPNLNRPFILLGTSMAAWVAPGQALYNFALRQALYNSKATLKSAFYHVAGNAAKAISHTLGDWAFATPSWTVVAVLGYASEKTHQLSQRMLTHAATIAAPKTMLWGQRLQLACNALNILAKPVAFAAACWVGYVLARHFIEPPPFEAPPGLYPNGGPIVEITQEEARNKSMVFTCPAPLARTVQERVLLCERDPTLIQKTKSIAARWCDQAGLQGNQRYQAICGAVAAALTVPCNEQLVIQLAQTHAVQQQHGRLARYLAGIKHQNDPWWTKYLLIRR